MTEEHLRTGDKATVRFRFIKNPEYLKPDMRMVFREGRTKAVGNITRLFPHVSAVAQNTRHQRSAKKGYIDGASGGSGGHSGGGKHSANPQNEPQKASKRNRRAKKMPDYDDGWEGKENNFVAEKGGSSLEGKTGNSCEYHNQLQRPQQLSSGGKESPRLTAGAASASSLSSIQSGQPPSSSSNSASSTSPVPAT